MPFRTHDPRLLFASLLSLVVGTILCLGWYGCAQVPPRQHPPFWTKVVGYGSMGDAFPVGRRDLVLNYSYDKLRVGLIAAEWTFKDGQQVVQTHRIVAQQGDDWITKGDANALPDPKPLTRRTYAGAIAAQPLDPMGLGYQDFSP